MLEAFLADFILMLQTVSVSSIFDIQDDAVSSGAFSVKMNLAVFLIAFDLWTELAVFTEGTPIIKDISFGKQLGPADTLLQKEFVYFYQVFDLDVVGI